MKAKPIPAWKRRQDTAPARLERFRASRARYLRELSAARTDARREQVRHNVARCEREIFEALAELGALEVSNRPRRDP